MGRPIRIEYPGALYHVISRGNERKNIFDDANDRQKFLQILADYHDRLGILLHCYVMLDNHYHLLLETPEGNLIKVMHGINSSYTGYFNRKYLRSGHLFQGRYKAIVVDKENYLLELSRYIHMNPVRAGIVKNPEQYAWSSYSGYINKSKRLDWVEYSWILSQFGPESKVKNYRRFIEQVTESGNPLKVYENTALGNKGFIEKIKQLLKAQKIDQEIAGRKRLLHYPKPEEILSIVASAFGQPQKILVDKKVRNNTGRKVAIYLIKRFTGLDNREIGILFGGIHYSAVSKASARLEQELARDKKLAKIVEGVMSNVKT